MGSLFVVNLPKMVELGLLLGERFGGRLAVQPLLQRLVEPFDLALGLRMPGMAVFLDDAQRGKQIFVGVFAAGES